MNKCNICEVELDQPGKIETCNCGGDCLMCMAIIAEDPDCIKHLIEAGDKGLLTNQRALEFYQERKQ